MLFCPVTQWLWCLSAGPERKSLSLSEVSANDDKKVVPLEPSSVVDP